MEFIETNIVASFAITFFILLCLIAIFTWKSCKKYFQESVPRFIEDHIVSDYDDEPYKPLKRVNDIEVDAETIDGKTRHELED